jgi:ParB-like chromosome segregation protein Spo0J
VRRGSFGHRAYLRDESTDDRKGRIVARMNPIGSIKNAALGTLRHPLGATQKVVGQAVGVARDTAGTVAHRVTGLVPGRKSRPTTPTTTSRPVPAPETRKVHGDPMAPKAPARKKTAAKKPAAKKPAKAAAKKPTKKTAAPSAPSAPPKKAPPSAAEVAAGEDSEVTTPVGTTGADVATNPDTTETDLQEPGTEPLMDPGTVKAVASEAETLQKGADTDKG